MFSVSSVWPVSSWFAVDSSDYAVPAPVVAPVVVSDDSSDDAAKMADWFYFYS